MIIILEKICLRVVYEKDLGVNIVLNLLQESDTRRIVKETNPLLIHK